MCEHYCTIIDVEFACPNNKVCENLKREFQGKLGLITGARTRKIIFVRGSGVVVSNKHVVTSAALFPLAVSHFGVSLKESRCSVLIKGGKERQDGRFIGVIPFTLKPLGCSSGVAVIELDNEFRGCHLSLCLSQSPPPSGTLVEVRGGGAFGHPVFGAPLFSGVVSGTACDAGVMLLDVRAPPGLEGALVVRTVDCAPVGILLHSLLVDGKAYPLSLAASLERLYDALSASSFLPREPVQMLLCPSVEDSEHVSYERGRKAYVETCSKTVFLTSAKAWATGILVSPNGLIVTCAHFVRASGGSPIRAAIARTGESLGVVRIARKPPPSVPWDAAVLKPSKELNSNYQFYDINNPVSTTPLGTTVYVIGYHLIQPQLSECSIGPLCLRGALAKTVTVGGRQVMHMVNAPSFFGASGGPVVCSDGSLLGICVSNIEGANQTPSVCLVLPTSVLRDLGSFTKTFDQEQQERIRTLWRVELDFCLPKKEIGFKKATVTAPKL